MKFALVLLMLIASVSFALEANDKAAAFTLNDVTGKQVKLSDYEGKNVVLIFIATRCPYSNAFNQVMAQLAKDYSARGITILGINSNKTEPVEEVAQHAKEKGLSFTILKDVNNKVADVYSASVTPEAYVIDKTGTIRYHGALGSSGRPTTDPSAANSDEIRAALDQLLAGQAIAKAKTKAFGCSIKRVS
jgi:peroxiredoxin